MRFELQDKTPYLPRDFKLQPGMIFTTDGGIREIYLVLDYKSPVNPGPNSIYVVNLVNNTICCWSISGTVNINSARLIEGKFTGGYATLGN